MNNKAGAILKKMRGKRKIKDVAMACNISPSSLSMYERGERTPRDAVKLKLAKFYNKAVQNIFFT